MITRDLLRLERLDTTELLEWAKSQPLTPEAFLGKPTSRTERWWGLGVSLYDRTPRVYESLPINSEPVIERLRQTFYPEANSVLLYHYPKGAGIGEHTDKPCFNNRVVIINLIDEPPDLFRNKSACKFKLGRETHLLGDGDVIEFDALIPHSVPPVKSDRYSLSFRIVGGRQ